MINMWHGFHFIHYESKFKYIQASSWFQWTSGGWQVHLQLDEASKSKQVFIRIHITNALLKRFSKKQRWRFLIIIHTKILFWKRKAKVKPFVVHEGVLLWDLCPISLKLKTTFTNLHACYSVLQWYPNNFYGDKKYIWLIFSHSNHFQADKEYIQLIFRHTNCIQADNQKSIEDFIFVSPAPAELAAK